jgi:hypothetical protein
MSQQPKWKLVANLGDVNPLDYGGYFVLVDETGVYCPEGEWLDPPVEGCETYTVRRFILDQCIYSHSTGILSDNRFHPESPAWFATPELHKLVRPQDSTYLTNLAKSYDMEVDELVGLFCSYDPIRRAEAYRMVGEYHGWENLDDYPLELSHDEAIERYTAMGVIKPMPIVGLPDTAPPGEASKADPLGDVFFLRPDLGGEG